MLIVIPGYFHILVFIEHPFLGRIGLTTDMIYTRCSGRCHAAAGGNDFSQEGLRRYSVGFVLETTGGLLPDGEDFHLLTLRIY